jgi:hypothetical protein
MIFPLPLVAKRSRSAASGARREYRIMATAWAPYKPSLDVPWNVRRVLHLHRRAGFAATWSEVQRDLADGPQASLDRLLSGKARSQGVPADFERIANMLGDAAVAAADAGRLKAWWVYRMLFGPDPLTERLALLWHNHFATSNAKVRDVARMRQQSEIFRRLARAPFGQLLGEAVRGPALLIWLDAPANRKGQPNENLGREVMELFTLGIGHYTETDVKEAARALTGWTVRDNRFHEDSARHDASDKTILGKLGKWRGDDLLRILVEHPATADRLAWRLCTAFMGEKAVNAAGLRALATGLCEHNLHVGWAVETVLRSQAFFADANLGTRVREPVEHVVSAARALELFDPPPSTLALADWAARLGQELFYPPTVFGWAGGRAWITPRAALRRTNYAAALIEGEAVGRLEPVDALGLARRHKKANDLESCLRFFVELLLGRDWSPAWGERLRTGLGPRPGLTPETVRQAAMLVLASPEAQLG